MTFSLRKGGLYKHTIMDFIELLAVLKHLHKVLTRKIMFENFETKHLQIKAEKALTGREALGSALGTEELVHL